MPQIPRYFSREQIPVESQPRIPVGFAGQEAGALARVGQDVANIGFELDKKLKSLKQIEDMTRFTTQADEHLMNLHNETLTEPDFYSDPEGAQNRFKAKAQQFRDATLNQITDPEVKVRWQAQFDRDTLTRQADIIGSARKQRINSAQGTGLRSLDFYSQQAYRAGTEADRRRYTGKGIATIKALEASGAWTSDFAAKKERQFISQINTSIVNANIREKPEETLEALLAGEFDLEADDQDRAIARAQKTIDTRLTHQDAVAHRRELQFQRETKELRNQREMDGWSALDKGELDMETLDSWRDRREIDPDGYKALRRGIIAEDGIHNPEIELALTEQLYDPTTDKQQLKSQVLRMAGKQIQTKTASEMLGKIRQFERDDDVSRTPEYKKYYDFIDDQLKVSGPGAAILDPDAETRRASAKREYDDRVRAASRDGYKTESIGVIADDIVDRYRANPLSPSAFPRPKHLAGPLNDMAAIADAETKTVEAFKSGSMNPDEFWREAENLKRIKDVLTRQQESSKPTGDKKKYKGRSD